MVKLKFINQNNALVLRISERKQNKPLLTENQHIDLINEIRQFFNRNRDNIIFLLYRSCVS
jgi:hypothetical protein